MRVIVLGCLLLSACATRSAPAPTKMRAPVAAASPARTGALFDDLDHSFDRAAANQSCEHCHAEIAEEWRASLHRASYDSPTFLEALAIEPKAFCRNCHSPESDPRTPMRDGEKLRALTGFGAGDGVACVTCHAPYRGEAPLHATTTPQGHPALREASLLTTRACGDCHQFQFPDAAFRTRTEWMQLTMVEHARSQRPSESCTSCHMPRIAGTQASHLSHRFDASRDEAAIRSAAHVTAARAGSKLTLTVTLGDVGHAFPTGDLLRRLAITAFAGDAARPVSRATRFLGRHFGDAQEIPGIVVRVVRRDDRLSDAPRTIEVDLPGALALPITWRVAYQRVQHLGAGETDAKVAGEITVAEGILAP